MADREQDKKQSRPEQEEEEGSRRGRRTEQSPTAGGREIENPPLAAGDASGEAPRPEDSPLDFYQVDTDEGDISEHPLDPEFPEDSLYIGTDGEEVAEEIARYTDDPDVVQDFEERQATNAGSQSLLSRIQNYQGQSMELSADDIDADWEGADQSGEETVGGTVPTPDQDMVEELGEAVGITYDEDEPLDTYGKLAERDLHRYELDPESAEDLEEELEGEEDEDD